MGNAKTKYLDSNLPPDEMARELLPTSGGPVGASIHGLHGSY